jgi:hypothetical protein
MGVGRAPTMFNVQGVKRGRRPFRVLEITAPRTQRMRSLAGHLASCVNYDRRNRARHELRPRS